MNKLTIIGNVTRDPETRTTSNGKNVCSFTVAVNSRKGEKADFFRVSAWDKKADLCQQYLAKGRKVAVMGPVSVSVYQSNSGETRADMNVNADEVEFLSRGENGSGEPEAPAPAPAKGYTDVTNDEDLPF